MSSSRTPRTSTPPAAAWDEASACPSTIGKASLTPGTLFTVAASSAKSVIGLSMGAMKMWPLMPTILLRSSLRNPFITDSTMMSVATPSMMPAKEKPAMTEMKPSRRRARR